MNVRPLVPADIPTLKRWHEESGFDYDFPDLLSKEFVCWVLADDHDQPVQAFAARKTVELYMLADLEWGTPRARLMALQVAHEHIRQELLKLGYGMAEVWLPPQVARSFGKRLVTLFGWRKNKWDSFCREIE